MKRILIFLTFFLVNVIYSQIDRPADHYSLIKGVNVSHNLNSGSTGYYIPLYNLNLGTLILASKLDYESNGFKPILQPGIAGLNWNIKSIGKITRENHQILNSSSELRNLRYASSGGISDFIPQDCPVPEKLSLNPGFRKKDLLTNLPAALKNVVLTEKFFFDFFGFKGYFIIDNEKQVIVNCETGNLKVSLDDLNCQSLKKDINFSQIIIKDDKGNKFYFGGDYSTLDINYVQAEQTESYIDNSGGPIDNSYQYEAKTRANYIIGWNLKKVELSDGRNVTINYISQSQQILADFVKEGQKKPKNVTFSNNFPSKTNLINNNLFITNSTAVHSSSVNDLMLLASQYYYSKFAAVDNIIVDNVGSINFNYDQTTNPLEISNIYLKEISIKDLNNKIIDKYDFEFQNLGGNNKRTFLASLRKNNIEKYYFNYNKTDEFPNYLGGNINSLGYWNQKGDVGLLKKVKTPTMGEIEFEYEPNTSSFDYRGPFLNLVENPINDAGGARIKKQIAKSNTTSQPEIITYSYSDENGKSTGIRENSNEGVFETNTQLIYANSYINYSKVTEGRGNGEVVYKFSDYRTNPDTLSVKTYNLSNNLYTKISRNQERGKLIEKSVYSLNNSLVLKTEYKYTNFLNGLSDGTLQYPDENCITCKITDLNYYVYIGGSINPMTGYKSIAYSYISVLPYVLASEKTTEYQPFLQIVIGNKINNYEYNKGHLYWHSYPIKTTTINNGESNTLYNFYPGDLLKRGSCPTSNCSFTNQDQPGKKMLTYKQMIDKNVVGPILTINKNSFGKYTLSENIFSNYNNRFRLAFNRISEANSNFTENNFENANTYTAKEYNSYDSKENLIQATTKSGIPTTTIWGYHQTMPIIQIKGATYAQIMQAFGLDSNNPDAYLQLEVVKKSDLDTDFTTEDEFISKLKDFTNKSEFKDFEITAYCYDPLIGVKTIIQPSGISEFYKYDNANRLDKILDANNNIMKQFSYNYQAATKYSNVFQSKVFYKNNCSDGHSSEAYVYTVPANSYTSYFSQIEADEMAQNEINANGQNIANQNLMCTSSCSISFFNGISSSYMNIYSIDNSKVSFNLKFNSGNVVQWNVGAGASIGAIQGLCKPSSLRIINYIEPNSNSSWQIRIDPIGNVSAKLLSGSVPNTINFQFEYYK